VQQATLAVTTRFGELQVPSAELKTLRVAQAGPPPDPHAPSVVKPPSQDLDKTWRNSLGMEFVLIPAGAFRMGSTDHAPDEQPSRTVRLSRPFYLGKYEVTQEQYGAVMGVNFSQSKGNPAKPVEMVSWDEVQQFIRQLNAQEGTTAYRLPTEAEWEYAARAGTTTAYSFGNDAGQEGDSRAPLRKSAVYRWDPQGSWVSAELRAAANPRGPDVVGKRQPNAWGLHDMSGNVAEWVHDWYGPYDPAAVTDPQGPASGEQRVVRGGSWQSEAEWCRSSARAHEHPDKRYPTVGFRLLRLIP
jgi:formylglycine-generating enzyme required for sulfatase activity